MKPELKGTKLGILEEFEKELRQYGWAADADKLARFMQAATDTLAGGNHIDRTGHAWRRALELNGLFGAKKQTLKFLHALPDGERH
jgi:hypothetical protein